MKPEYTAAEIATVIRMRDIDRAAWRAIAKAIGRDTVSGIRSRYVRAKVLLEDAAEADTRALLSSNRRCMCCPAWILSEGSGHRLCDDCRDKSEVASHALAGARIL